MRLTDDEVYAFLDRGREGVLSTVGSDGYPYGTPVNYVRIGNRIYFHGSRTGEKADNISRCVKVCLTVVSAEGFEKTGPAGCNTTALYESVIVRGDVNLIDDHDKKKAVLTALLAKLTPVRVADGLDDEKVDATEVFEIVPVSATGKCRRPIPGNPRL